MSRIHHVSQTKKVVHDVKVIIATCFNLFGASQEIGPRRSLSEYDPKPEGMCAHGYRQSFHVLHFAQCRSMLSQVSLCLRPVKRLYAAAFMHLATLLHC